MSNVAELNIAITAGAGAATQTFNSVVAGANKMGAAVDGVSSRLGGFATSLAGMAIGAAGIGSAVGAMGLGISAAAQAEQAQIAFETMLKDGNKAQQLLGELNTFAADTPFELPGIVGSARKLLAFGESADNIVPTLRALGDVSAGIGAPLEEIAELYGKARVQGRLMAEDINQLTGRGIPIIGQLAKEFGVAESEVRGLVEKGSVNFTHLQRAMKDLTSNGGVFEGLMAKQSKSLGGLWSTLKDNVSMSLRGIAEAFSGAFNLKGVLAGLSDTVQYFTTSWVPSIKASMTAVATTIQTVWSGVSSAAVTAFNYITPIVTEAIQVLQPMAPYLLTAAGAFLSMGAAPAIWTAISGALMAVGGAIVAMVAPLFSVVGAISLAIAIGVEWYGGWSKVISDLTPLLTTLWQGMLTAFSWIRDAAVVTFAVAKWAIQNWWDLSVAAVLNVQLGFVTLWESMKHFFGTTMPELLSFAARNWQGLATDMWNISKTVLYNLYQNYTKFWESIWNYVYGNTDAFEFAWTPLTDGFKSAITETLKLTEREIKPWEADLRQRTAAAGAKVGQSFADAVNGALRQAKVVNPIDEKTQAAANQSKNRAMTDASYGGKGKTAAQKIEAPKALLAGTKEAFDAIMEARSRQRGTEADAGKETAENTKESADELKTLNRWLRTGSTKLSVAYIT